MDKIFSHLTGPKANPTPFSKGTIGSFPWGKGPERETGHHPSLTMRGTTRIPPLPHIPSWRGI